MHLDILVEDISGKTALDVLVPKIIGRTNTFNVRPYKGQGRLPQNLQPKSDPEKRILLDQLPRLIRGFGNTYAGYGPSYAASLVVVCDLDRRCLKEFRDELNGLLHSIAPAPTTRFCVAIEELEAWYLGDTSAILQAFPEAKQVHLQSYKCDCICDTWESLSDAIYRGGSAKLRAQSWFEIGRQKSEWAAKIAPLMNVDENNSPSFCYFRDALRSLCASSSPPSPPPYANPF